MAIDFPSGPTIGQQYTYNNVVYTYTSQGIWAVGTNTPAFAPLASPVFTGDPQAPTPLTSDNDTSIATTAFVKTAVVASLNGNIGALTLAGTAPIAVNFAGSTFTWTVSAFGTAASGIVPASGGGTTNFLRADGTWATPASAGGGFTTVNVQTFTASGTYTPTSGMKYCQIEAVGGGGGGGGITGQASYDICGGGGGSGGYSRKTVAAATVGASQTVTIGAAGGAGASAGTATGGNGGQTSVGTLCVANGGQGGNGGNMTLLIGGNGANLTGAVGDVVAAGSPGQAGSSILTTQGTNGGANGGSSYFGGGASAPGMPSGGSTAGVAGSNYGAGGASAVSGNNTTPRTGGAGSAGFVVITEYL